MADAQANINVNLDTSQALAQLRGLQRQISLFQQQMARGNANTVAQAQGMQRNLLNSINATGQFSARMTTVSTATESFTNALEKNKFSMGEYFRYAGGASKNFGRFFKNEMNLVGKVARERVKDLQTQYIKMGRDTSGAMRGMAVRPLTLDMENYATKTAIAAQKQQIFNQLIRQGSTNLLNWGKNTQWAGRQLMVGFTIPLSIMGATAISEFRKLEEQAVKFRRVYGDMFTTSADTEKALDNIRELADEFTKYGIAVEKTIDLAAKVAQMGNMGDALEAQVTQATRLAVLGGLEQKEALDTTISLTNAFGVATEDLADKISFLNAAENQTILAIEDFNEAIPKAGSVVQQLGGDVEDLAFFLTAMREGGINASQGANALKSSLGRLVNPTEVAKNKMAELGIDIVGIVENNVGDLRGTIMELGHELDDLAPLDRSRAIEQMFGKFQFARMSTMFQNIVKDGSQAQKVLELTTNSSEELAILAERELARVEESPAFKLQKSFEQLKASLAPLGEQFIKIVTPIIEFGTDILKKFDAMGEGGKRFATIAVSALGLVAPAALMIIGLIANGVANLAKFFQMMLNVGKRGSTSMTQLGAQTQYMTQEQIEASAVAASLNNSHERLRQTFTSEAAAVRSLTTAYQQGIGAQRAFAFGPTGRGAATAATRATGMANGGIIPGYANGVVSVPGPKGAGDIVPAMLSPGEAVIPRDMVTKYSPLIEGMIAGNLPGYDDGGIIKAGHVVFGNEMLYSEASMMAPGNQSAAGVDMNWLRRGGSDVAASLEGSLLADPEDFAMAGERLGPVADKLTENLADAAQGTEDFASAGRKSYKQMLRTIDEQKELGNITEKEAKGLKRRVRKLFKPTRADRREIRRSRADLGVDEKGRVVQRRQIPATVEGGGYRKATREATKTARARRGMSALPAGYQAAHASKPEASKSPAPAPKVSSTVPTAAAPVVTAAAASATAAGDKGLKEHLAAQQESTKATKDQTSKTQENTKATRKSTRATTTNTKKSESHQRGWVTRRQNQSLDRVNAMTSRQPILAYPGGVPETSQGPAAPGRFKRFMNMGRGGGGMGMAMAGSAVAMGASMLPGKAGQVAQGAMPAIMALSMLPVIVSMLGGPITALVAIVGGAVAGFITYNKALKDAARQAYELERALGSSKEAIQNFAEFAGNVTTTELYEKQRQQRFDPFSIGAGKTTFGESFFESDPGTELSDNVKKSLISVGEDETVELVFSQLGRAVADNALSVAQARSIATELGDQLDNIGLGMQVNAKLMQLLGPGNEDLTAGDKLEILGILRIEREEDIKDIEFDPMTYGEGFTEASEKFGEDIVTNPFLLLKPENFKIAWSTLLGLPQAKTTVANLGEILAKGANNADAFATDMANIDSLYAEDLARAYADEDSYEINRLEEARAKDREDALRIRKESNDKVLSALSEDMPKAQVAMKEALRSDFAEDEEGLKLRLDLLDRIQKLNLEDAKELELQYLLTSGDMPLSVATNIVENYDKRPNVSNKILEIQTEFGGALSGDVDQIFDIFDEIDSALAEDFVLSLDVTDIDKLNEQVEGFGAISKITNLFPEGEEILLDLALKDPTILTRINNDLEKIEGIDNKQLTLDFISQEFGPVALEAASEIWDDIPVEDRKEALYSILTSLDLELSEGFNELFESLKGQTIAGVTIEEPEDILSLIGSRAAGTAEANRSLGTGNEGAETGDGGGGPDTSWLDKIVKQVRDVNFAQQELTQGFDSSLAALENFANGAAQGFDGLANQLRGINVSEALIEKILGLSPEEWEEQKDQIFQFDIAGNIAGLTAAGQAIQDSLNIATIGSFISEQDNITISVNNQIVALNKLTSAGASYEAAYRAVQNTALASAIATARASREIQAAAEAAMRAQEMMDKFEEINEEEQRRKGIRDAVRQANREFAEQAKILDYINRNRSRLNDDQISELLSDKNLRSLALEPNIDPGALKTALENARKKADLELRVQVTTEEGKFGLFDEMVSEVMSFFSRESEKININFELNTLVDDSLIREVENQIASMQFMVDDYEAQLREIENAEEEINTRYEKRFEALDKIATINDRIAAQQQNQISLAEALSSGDIAAAAQAAQQMREQESADNVETQREILEQRQQAEIDSLRSASGLSRKNIEEKIKELEDEIFRLEEERIEPAQERIRLAEYDRDLQIASLEVSGKTRLQWEEISNLTAIAAQDTEEFAKNVERALALFEYFVAGVPLPLDLFGGEFTPQLEKMGVDIEKESARAAAVDVIKSIDKTISTTPVDKEPPELTAVQKAALNVFDLNDKLEEILEERVQFKMSGSDPGERKPRSLLGESATGIANMSVQELRENLSTPLGILRPKDFGLGSGYSFKDEYEALLEENYKQIGIDFEEARQGMSASDARSATVGTSWINIARENQKDIIAASKAFVESVAGAGSKAYSADALERAFTRQTEEQNRSVPSPPSSSRRPPPPTSGGRSDPWSGSRPSPPPPPPPPTSGGRSDPWSGSSSSSRTTYNTGGTREKGSGMRMAGGGYVARMAMGGYVGGGSPARMALGGVVPYTGKGGSSTRMAMGGKVKGYPMGGLIPYKNNGGFFKSLGSDTVPAMLTPGEFVIRRPAVSGFGIDNLEKINRGTYNDGSVYNYNLAVNVKSDSNPDQIANTVMREIKRIDSQRIRNNRY